MQIRQALEEYEFYCLKHSEQTQTWYISRLKAFVDWSEKQEYELEKITAKIIRAYIDELRAKISPATGKKLSSYTVHGHARTIRTFFNWLAREDEFEELVSSKVGSRIPMPKIEIKVIQTFTKDEIQRLMVACDQNIYPMLIARNKAILAVLLDTGIRAGELCGLTLDDVFIQPGGSFLRVLGKGNKEREVGLGQKSQVALSDYLEHHRDASLDEPHIFITHRHEPLSINGLNQALYRLADRAGVQDCHAHKFRHTYACNFLLQGGDIYMLSRLMGHTSTEVTEVYVRTVKSQQARVLSKSVFDQL